MAFAERDGVRLYWRLEGAAGRPALLLLHSIGTDMSLWDGCMPHLLPQFRVLRMDVRGHGASDAPPGDYSLAMLADDALAVMDAAGVARATVCGLSLGGMAAMTLALAAPQRVENLVLACTSAAMDRAVWENRLRQLKTGGLSGIVDVVLDRFFSPGFRRTHPAQVESVRAAFLAMSAQGYAGCGAAIRDMDIADRIPGIAAPTLVIAGRQDMSTPFEAHGARIVAAIKGAERAFVDAAHLAAMEAPADFSALLRAFADRAGPARAAAQTLYEAGLATRRKVLGDAWVDRSMARRTPFNTDFQEMITRTAWNEVWNRPGLDHRTRRLLVLAMTASLGRWEEFRLHVRAGLGQGGFTEGELKEVLIQCAVYAGVPAANTAFAEAAAAMEELQGEA